MGPCIGWKPCHRRKKSGFDFKIETFSSRKSEVKFVTY